MAAVPPTSFAIWMPATVMGADSDARSTYVTVARMRVRPFTCVASMYSCCSASMTEERTVRISTPSSPQASTRAGNVRLRTQPAGS